MELAMIIWGLLILVGLALLALATAVIMFGINRKKRGWILVGIVLPLAYWLGILALHSREQSYLEELSKDNDGAETERLWWSDSRANIDRELSATPKQPAEQTSAPDASPGGSFQR